MQKVLNAHALIFFMPQKIRIITVGKVKEPYLQMGINEYRKRLAPYCKLEIFEIKDMGIEKEACELEKFIMPKTYVLDAEGAQMDSVQFSKLFSSGEKISFIIGGPEGISPALKKKAKLISLSKMTFTHEMCALFLLEQIYRSFMIIKNKPYHR